MKKLFLHILRPYFALFVILAFSILFLAFVRLNGTSGNNWSNVISSDGKGYYQYFVVTLFQNSDSINPNHEAFTNQVGEHAVIKYFVGLPLLWSPFVLIAYLFDTSRQNPYDFCYSIAISIAALFYLIIGLFALIKLLKALKFDEKVISISLYIIFFGTNLSYYALVESSMSHVYSFSLISVFIYCLYRFFSVNETKWLVFASLVFGFMILLRPINVISIVLIFVFITSFRELKKLLTFIFLNPKMLLVLILLVLMPLLIQLLFWRLQTNQFVVWPYSGEGFYFSHPHLLSYLFSFRKGLFVYTPLIVLAMLAFPSMYLKNRFHTISLFFVALFLFYVISSWWNWSYGDSFGARAAIDFYLLFVFLLAVVTQEFVKSKKGFVVFLLIVMLGVGYNGLKSYQYYTGILSKFDMNWNKFSYTFFETRRSQKDKLGGYYDLPPYHTKLLQILPNSLNNVDSSLWNINNSKFISFSNTLNHLASYNLQIQLKHYYFNQTKDDLYLHCELYKSKTIKQVWHIRLNEIDTKQLNKWVYSNYSLSFALQKGNYKLLISIENPTAINAKADLFHCILYQSQL